MLLTVLLKAVTRHVTRSQAAPETILAIPLSPTAASTNALTRALVGSISLIISAVLRLPVLKLHRLSRHALAFGDLLLHFNG